MLAVQIMYGMYLAKLMINFIWSKHEPGYVSLKLDIFPIPRGVKYDKQDQQGKAAFKERNPHPTQ
jgi:hypothetical protein